MKWFEDANKRIIVFGVCGLLILGNGVASADFAFGTPRNLGPEINSPQDEYCVDVSDDGLCLFFSDSPFSWRPGGKGNIDLWMATRGTISEPFGPPVNMAELNTGYHDFSPHLSPDGLTIFFSSDRPGGRGDMDLWMATRTTRTAPFGKPLNLGSTINSGAGDFCPCPSSDGLSLYFNSSRWGGHGSCDLYVAKRATVNSPWRTPVNLGSRINSNRTEGNPQISDDGLWLFYSSSRTGGLGEEDLYMVTRETVDSVWGTPVNMGPSINTPHKETSISICPKACAMFIVSGRFGGVGRRDIWEIPVAPIVDFNGDGKVDEVELTAVVDHWHTDTTLCDVAPAPFGDGFVDVQDLLVFAECVSAGVYDPTLAAHWAFDETQGMIASDNAGGHDGTVVGIPAWLPADGAIGGALEFDGATLVVADSVLNPREGPFSVLAWVKGGALGQAIIAQQGGANWLMADASQGALMTGLRSGGRTSKALSSQAVITDGDWHRVGFTWDGSSRRLYVDDILVAEDTDIGLAHSTGDLNIGCGKNLEPGNFFSGLIDDIRIYNRVITPEGSNRDSADSQPGSVVPSR